MKTKKHKARPQPIRARILAGARRHFFSHGFRGVTMDDLAAELGMSKKTFYQHFPSKNALLEAVLEDKFRSVDDDLGAAVADCGEKFSDCLRLLLVSIQRQTQELQPAFVRDMQRSAPELFRRVQMRRAEIIQRHFSKLLTAGQKVGLIRKDIPVKVAIEILLGTTQAIIHPVKVLELGLTPEKAFSAVIAVFLEGMITVQGEERKMTARCLTSACNLSWGACLAASCQKEHSDRVQGYIEGEFVYVASPLPGALQKLSVQRGAEVKVGDPLYELDETMEKAARDQARAALVLSEAEFKRQEEMFGSGVSAAQELDRARSARDQDRERLTQANMEFLAEEPASAPRAGLVFDTLYREGEWVRGESPGHFAPPAAKCEAARLRSAATIGAIHQGDPVRVFVDGAAPPVRRQSQFRFAARRIHAAGHLQPREPGETRLHGRGGFRRRRWR